MGRDPICLHTCPHWDPNCILQSQLVPAPWERGRGERAGGPHGARTGQGTSVPQPSPVLRLGMLKLVVGGDQSQPNGDPT